MSLEVYRRHFVGDDGIHSLPGVCVVLVGSVATAQNTTQKTFARHIFFLHQKTYNYRAVHNNI